MKNSFDQLDSIKKGGATYLYLILKEMFKMSRDVVNALKTFLQNFSEKGFSRHPGENVSIMTKQLRAVCISLDEVGALPGETPLDILQGLSICSNSEFKAVYQHQVTEERISSL